ncbi:hypothetical protein ACD661_15565 [Legionella lytica]|uniref:Uncharacterized protein n=1 Tax=Legionella lytica TaxID=96232 RepID=A0ABW8DB78_9GAMM
MARLDDLLPELKDDAQSPNKSKDEKSLLITGKKRRAWLVDTIERKPSVIQRGGIDPIDRHESSVELRGEKRVLTKGSIDLVYKPESLGFKDLRSNPLQLFSFLYELMEKENDGHKTPRVKLRDMMNYINISKDSARTALRFLLKQNFIQRIEFQPGHLGWSRYKLNENICNELKREISKGTFPSFKVSQAKRVESVNPSDFEINDPWDNIDITALESIGFNKKHLLQIKNKSTPEITQESINHFAYALKYNKKTSEYSNPVATLIAVLKRGEAWIETDYQSPQELAQIQIFEAKKAELQRKKDLEEQLYKMALEEWLQSLSPKDIDNFAPDLRKKGDPTPPNAKLGIYFKENIWPNIRKDYGC